MRTQIHSRRSAFGLLGLILLLSSVGAALARSSAPTNTLTFSESLRDKVVCAKEEGDWYCDMFTGDSFTISATILLAGVAITNFDQDTSFDLSVGELDVSHILGDDPHYATNKTSATFVDTYTDDNNKSHVYQTTKLKWTAKQLTVTITGKTSDIDTSDLTPIMADSYDGNDSGPINDTTSGSVDLGDASVTFDTVTVTGTVATKDVIAKDENEFWPSTVKIKGVGVGASSIVTPTNAVTIASLPALGR
jgi:hypothetical protein